MDFTTLIQFFKEWSGRVDLEDSTIVQYLNSGQKFLDDMTDFQQNPGRYFYAGTSGISFINLLAQAKVISGLSLIFEGTVSRVTEIPISELQVISDELPSYRANGLPEFFALANLRKVSAAALSAEDRGKLAVIETGTVSDHLGIVFECPLDKAYTVDITGKFYSPTIEEGIDPDTFWAVQYPFTLVHAALYKLEISYRNTEGSKDWLSAILTDLRNIDHNVAEQAANSISEMKG